MRKYILGRLAKTIPVLCMIMVITFFVIRCMPGDPARMALGDKATEAQIEELQIQLGLDKSLPEQFVNWIQDISKGDLGESLLWKRPVIEIIFERMEPTFILAIIGQLLGTFLGVMLGMIAAIYYQKIPDYLFQLVSLIAVSIPCFWLLLVMIQIFGVKLSVFPVAGYTMISSGGVKNAIHSLMMPGIALGIMQSGQIARMTRTTLAETMKRDYLRTARAKGMDEKVVIAKHAFINTLGPVINVIGNSFATLLGGTWVVESICNIPGIGNLALNAISNRDYPLIQGTLLFVAVIFTVMNLVVDIVCSLINPKVRC